MSSSFELLERLTVVHLKRKFRIFVATMMLAGLAAVAVPGSASATAADCAGGANGFVDIPDTLGGTDVEDVRIGNHWLYLNFGTVSGATRGWALLFEGSYEPLQTNASVWLDWSQDGGKSWIQCGPFFNSKGKTSITSAAKKTSSSPYWIFRAGAMVNGEMQLSQWH
jgi:hypothetical protein